MRYIDEDGTIYLYFTTVDGFGEPVAPSSAFTTSDVAIHKNGSATQKTSTNGLTMTSPFDSKTGLHLLTIDTSNDTGDAGFWTEDGAYKVRFETSKTVDGKSIDGMPIGDGFAGEFTIRTELVATDIVSGGAITTSSGKVTVGTNDDKTGYSLTADQSAVTIGTVNTMAGTIQTLDALDTAQDSQHSTTQSAISALNNVSTAQVNTAVDTALTDFFTSSSQLVDDIWDEVITGANHNVNASAAKFLREASQAVAITGTAQGGTASTITLESGAVTANDLFNGERVSIIEGTGEGQSRLIIDSAITTDVVTVAHNWTVNPDNTSVYAIMGAEVDLRAVAEQSVSATATVDFDDLATIEGDLSDGGRLDLIIDAILADTNELQTDDIPGLIAALNDPTTAAIASAVWSAATRTVTAATNITSDGSAITSSSGSVTVGTNSDKTGYSISGTLTTLDALDTAQDSQHSTTQSAIAALNDPTAGAIADAVWTEAIADHSGTVGSTAEALNAAGGGLTAAAIADAVLDEALSGHTTAGTLGKAISDTESDVTTLLSRITSTLFSGITSLADWLGIMSGKTADATTLAEINATTAGANYDNTNDSQEALRDRGDVAWSAVGSVNVTPLTATTETRVNGTTINYYVGETIAQTVAITDSAGSAVNLTGKTLQVVIDSPRPSHGDVQVIANANITISGASSNQVTFTNSAAVTASARTLRWALRDTSNNKVLGRGQVRVTEAAKED